VKPLLVTTDSLVVLKYLRGRFGKKPLSSASIQKAHRGVKNTFQESTYLLAQSMDRRELKKALSHGDVGDVGGEDLIWSYHIRHSGGDKDRHMLLVGPAQFLFSEDALSPWCA